MDSVRGHSVELKEPEVFPIETAPTNIRWRLMGLTTLTTAVTILGRVNIGVLGKPIQDELGFSTQTMGWIFAAFAFAYHGSQIPGGWAADRFGPRKVLTFSILFWSVATAAMALVPGLAIAQWLGLAWTFAVLRFMVGVGEAPTSSNSAKIVSSWMGAGDRGLGISFHVLGIGLGGASSPVAIAWMAHRWGWRVGLYLSSLIGILFALTWWFYATDRPEEHPDVNAAELNLIRTATAHDVPGGATGAVRPGRAPWGRIFSSASVWAMLISYFCQGYTPYIFITWFFIYLERARGLTMMQGSAWGSLPFLAIVLLAPLGGWLSDFAVSRLGKRQGRRSTVWLGMGCSALLLWIGSHTLNNTAAILMLSAAAGLNYFSISSWWATCIDLTPTYAGSLTGVLQMFAGAWLSPILTAYIATHFGWMQALDFAALLTAIGAFLWIFVKADASLEDPIAPAMATIPGND